MSACQLIVDGDGERSLPDELTKGRGEVLDETIGAVEDLNGPHSVTVSGTEGFENSLVRIPRLANCQLISKISFSTSGRTYKNILIRLFCGLRLCVFIYEKGSISTRSVGCSSDVSHC